MPRKENAANSAVQLTANTLQLGTQKTWMNGLALFVSRAGDSRLVGRDRALLLASNLCTQPLPPLLRSR